ncbi:helix-turn-helix domain-containing protein [Chryseobacterium koreense]
MAENKRQSRLDNPEFRTILGKKLREKRLELNYSVSDISYMTTIPQNTVLSVENGKTANIDYYIEYAKAVNYPIGKLTEFGISLIPRIPLSAERKEASKLTAKIREYIIAGEFLSNGKTVAQIHDELIKLKLISPTQVSSTAIAGVMRNLANDNLVKVDGKDGRKNLYVRME